MYSELSRRKLIQAMGVAALPSQAPPRASIAGPRAEGRDTPKICLPIGTMDAAGMRRVKQLGVDHVLMMGSRIPWDESAIRSTMDSLKSGGLTLGNMMMVGFPNAIYGRAGRDEEIEKVR